MAQRPGSSIAATSHQRGTLAGISAFQLTSMETAMSRCHDSPQAGIATEGERAGGKPVQDAEQVLPGDLLPDVDVDLLRGERGPDQALAAVGEGIRSERQPWPRPVQAQQVLLPGAPGEDGPEGEEHPVAGRVRPLGKPVSELRGRAGN